MNWSKWTEGRYAYRADHVMRAALLVSFAVNVGLVLLVWVMIGFMAVWK